MGKSPLPKKKNQSETQTKRMNFTEALNVIMARGKVVRQAWGEVGIYGFMKDGTLTLMKPDGHHPWIVTSGDITGEDWIIYKEKGKLLN